MTENAMAVFDGQNSDCEERRGGGRSSASVIGSRCVGLQLQSWFSPRFRFWVDDPHSLPTLSVNTGSLLVHHLRVYFYPGLIIFGTISSATSHEDLLCHTVCSEFRCYLIRSLAFVFSDWGN